MQQKLKGYPEALLPALGLHGNGHLVSCFSSTVVLQTNKAVFNKVIKLKFNIDLSPSKHFMWNINVKFFSGQGLLSEYYLTCDTFEIKKFQVFELLLWKVI